MSLRGKKSTPKTTRFKCLLFGEAGIGKTTAAIQMPKPYIIDTEGGTETYGDKIEKRGGAVFSTVDFTEVTSEIRALATENHGYLTLVLDPFTTIYDALLEEGEKKVGSDFGRHYGYANKVSKRLYNLVSQLDMNVIFTAHAKNEYGDNMKVVGQTFDGWKRLDYLFHLVLFLERNGQGNQRIATVRKTRLEEFPDRSQFEWSYANLVSRYGKDRLERKSKNIKLASAEQIEKFNTLYNGLSDDEREKLKIDKVVTSLDDIQDLAGARVAKGIKLIENYRAALSQGVNNGK